MQDGPIPSNTNTSPLSHEEIQALIEQAKREGRPANLATAAVVGGTAGFLGGTLAIHMSGINENLAKSITVCSELQAKCEGLEGSGFNNTVKVAADTLESICVNLGNNIPDNVVEHCSTLANLVAQKSYTKADVDTISKICTELSQEVGKSLPENFPKLCNELREQALQYYLASPLNQVLMILNQAPGFIQSAFEPILTSLSDDKLTAILEPLKEFVAINFKTPEGIMQFKPACENILHIANVTDNPVCSQLFEQARALFASETCAQFSFLPRAVCENAVKEAITQSTLNDILPKLSTLNAFVPKNFQDLNVARTMCESLFVEGCDEILKGITSRFVEATCSVPGISDKFINECGEVVTKTLLSSQDFIQEEVFSRLATITKLLTQKILSQPEIESVNGACFEIGVRLGSNATQFCQTVNEIAQSKLAWGEYLSDGARYALGLAEDYVVKPAATHTGYAIEYTIFKLPANVAWGIGEMGRFAKENCTGENMMNAGAATRDAMINHPWYTFGAGTIILATGLYNRGKIKNGASAVVNGTSQLMKSTASGTVQYLRSTAAAKTLTLGFDRFRKALPSLPRRSSAPLPIDNTLNHVTGPDESPVRLSIM